MPFGPVSIEHAARLQNAHKIASHLQAHFGEHLLALGLYGSTAAGTDGPYSDIDMHCVVDTSGTERVLEWTNGYWKAKVNIWGINVILKRAAVVEPNWSIVQGAYVNVVPIYDLTNLFVHLKKTALSQPSAHFSRAMKELIVSQLFDMVGKLRNGGLSSSQVMLAFYAVEMARWGACLVGLENRTLYANSNRIFSDSLVLDNLPQGYDALCRKVMAGELSDQPALLQACEEFWQGVNGWARQKGLHLDNELDDLLNFLD